MIIRRIILVTILFFSFSEFFGQTQTVPPNCYVNFEEFKQNKPSLRFEFQLKKRDGEDVFMMGGIRNYRLKKIKPEASKDKVLKWAWGVILDDTIYINSYPYSKIIGFNEILEKGYYSYFIGDPARGEKEQRALGIIKETDKWETRVWGMMGYVILTDGTIKMLRPELLTELCKDNAELLKEIKEAKLTIENVELMFKYLKRYNSTKK